jgi:hypothetical protein
VLVLNSRALGVLEHLLVDSGELIPLECADGQYWLFNCTTVADPLDWEASDVVRLDSGRVLDINRPQFRMDTLPRGPFRVAGFTRGSLFIPELVASSAAEARLTGTYFEQCFRSTEDSLAT